MASLRLGDEAPLFREYVALCGPSLRIEDDVAAIGEDDALIIIDMQKDFIPFDPVDNPDGGRFGVAEGEAIIDSIVQLTNAFVRAGATVVATRDYHPCDHVSFVPAGPFPVHCVQGSEGSKFLPPIAEALAKGVRRLGTERVFVAFKGMHEHIDSFGALPYMRGGKGRIARSETLAEGARAPAGPTGCAAAPWTGSLVLKQSNLLPGGGGGVRAPVDMDAPPDVLAVSEDGVERKRASLQDALRGKRRVFVCGLALDFCVLDTCLNARECGFDSVHMLFDAARAAHVPGIGQAGSGFL